MEKENIQMVRKQFVFILNYAVDILKKEYIESDDLVLFSSEVKRFRDWVKMQDIPNELKFCLIEVNYSYTNTNKELADVSFLFFKRTILSWFQQRSRVNSMKNFLNKYDYKLQKIDEYKLY